MTDDHRAGVRRLGAGGPLSAEELAVRELMHHSVAGLQPEHGSLARIRNAVPRRRAVRRNVWTGVAAVALATAVVLPALEYPERLGLAGPAAASTADGSDPAADAADPAGEGASGHPSFPYSWGGPGSGPAGGSTRPGTEVSAGAGAATGGASVAPGAGAPAPVCTAAELANGPAEVGAPDAAGAVYGSFSVINISARSCTVTGPGALVVSATAGSGPTGVPVLDHLAGDAATALPDPVGTAAAGPPVLAPGAAFRVGFGWVPGGSCQAPGPATAAPAAAAPMAQGSPEAGAVAVSAAPSAEGPSPSATSDPTGASSATASPSTAPSAPATSITLAYTPAPAGSGTATAVLTGACGGTVYRTAPLAPPSGVPAAG